MTVKVDGVGETTNQEVVVENTQSVQSSQSVNTSETAGSVTPTVVQKTDEKNDGADPKWLASRLDRERKKLLRDLGVENEDEVKKAIARAKELEDANKSEMEKLREQNEKLRKELEVSKDYKEAVAVSAQKELSKLSEQQKAYVESVAGEDPAKVIKTIESLKASGLLKVEPVTPPVVQAPPAPPRVPATTAPGGQPPKPVETTVPSTTLEVWESLQKTNPFLAASFYTKNAASIIAEKEKFGKK